MNKSTINSFTQVLLHKMIRSMPYILTILMLTLLNCQNGQGNHEPQSEDCGKAKEIAKEDLRSNRLGLYFFGLMTKRSEL